MPGSAVTVSRFRADGATHSDSGVLQDASDTAANIGNDHPAIADIGLTSRPLSVDAAQVGRIGSSRFPAAIDHCSGPRVHNATPISSEIRRRRQQLEN
jgi:hypothetical protein